MRNRLWLGPLTALVVVGLAGCSGNVDGSTSEVVTTVVVAEAEETEQRFPDVVDAAFLETSERVFTVSVTLSSPYDMPDRYADAWRVSTVDGVELGILELTHDHASEQPFTRSQSDIAIPDEIGTVVIEGRDQQYGWGGATLTMDIPEESS